MRILLVAHRFPHDSTFLTSKFLGLLTQGHEVQFLAWDSQASRRAFERKHPVAQGRLVRIPSLTQGWDLLRYLLQSMTGFIRYPLWTYRFVQFARPRFGWKGLIARYGTLYRMKSARPDLIHFEFGTLAQSWIFVKEVLATKVTTSFRGYDLNYIALDDDTYYHEVWAKADGIHFLGNDLKNRAHKRGYQAGLYRLIPPAIDTALFQPQAEKSEHEYFHVLSVGRLHWKKGFEYGIRAVKQLVEEGTACRYTVVGAGPYREALEFTVHELGLTEVVTFAGSKTPQEIQTLLNGADVLLHPAISEGFCNVVIEAQAMKVPVVCTDADGLPENIAHGETGFVVPIWDVTAMAERLSYLYHHPKERADLGKKGRARVLEKFKIEDQVMAFVEFYQQVVDES